MNKRITKKKKILANSPSIVSSFDAKYNVLKKFEMNDPYLIETLDSSINTSIFKKITVFISISDKKSRAVVFNASSYILSDAFDKAAEKARLHIAKYNYNVVWLKADVTINWEIVKYEDFKNIITNTREFFYKKGISFDVNFETALLSEQLNTMGFINYKQKFLSLPKLREYYKEKGIQNFSVITDNVIVFSCMGYFCDEKENTYKLYFDEENYGRRVIKKIDKEF